MTLEFNYTTLDPSIAVNIQKAIEDGEMFGLAGKRSMTIFAPVQLQSIWLSKSSRMSGTKQQFNSINDLAASISLCLLGQKTFIPASKLLKHCEQNKLPAPK